MEKKLIKKNNNIYKSYDDYCKKIFPNEKKISLQNIDDPYIYGSELANVSKRKIKRILSS